MGAAPQAEPTDAVGLLKARPKPLSGWQRSKLARSRQQQRGEPELITLASLDGRTRASRRAYELIAQFTEQLGTAPTAIQNQTMLHAATLGIMIENMEVRALQGETIDSALYATLLNAQRRTLKAL